MQVNEIHGPNNHCQECGPGGNSFKELRGHLMGELGNQTWLNPETDFLGPSISILSFFIDRMKNFAFLTNARNAEKRNRRRSMFRERKVDYPSREAETMITPWLRKRIDSRPAVIYPAGLCDHWLGGLNTINRIATKITERVFCHYLTVRRSYRISHRRLRDPNKPFALPGRGREVSGNFPVVVGRGSHKGVVWLGIQRTVAAVRLDRYFGFLSFFRVVPWYYQRKRKTKRSPEMIQTRHCSAYHGRAFLLAIDQKTRKVSALVGAGGAWSPVRSLYQTLFPSIRELVAWSCEKAYFAQRKGDGSIRSSLPPKSWVYWDPKDFSLRLSTTAT
ncbi:hypothetical protein EV421DRAFT_1738542 [Armillaria borealis]|uniref:Uncharacterized protein n=1 Tax=Armillaria borealis TaxID=47425 RepID=A0AA39J8W7_9AGAR|nr:hypothetical protein EV421DRAFT_1738542 [Armillaria borealis]